MRAITASVTSAAPQALVRTDNYATAVVGVAVALSANGAESTAGNVYPMSVAYAGAASTAAPTIANPTGATGGVTLLTENAANAAHQFYDTDVANNQLTYTISFYAKYAGRQYLQIGCQDQSGAWPGYAIFDIVNGVITDFGQLATTGTINAKLIVPAGNGWFKITMSVTATATSDHIQYCTYNLCNRPTYASGANDGAGDVVYTGNGTAGVYFWQIVELRSASVLSPQFTIATSSDDANDLVNPVAAGSMAFDSTLLPSGAVNSYGQLTFSVMSCPLYWRLSLVNGVGAARMTLLQVGEHSHSNISKGPFAPPKIADELAPGTNFGAMPK